MADSDDVELGKVINCRGEETTLETMFEELRGRFALQSDVKDEYFETVRIPVDSLPYTQSSCASKFACGRDVDQTAKEFVEGKDPTKCHWCVLRVVKRAGLLLSVDNLRLYAFRGDLRNTFPFLFLEGKAKTTNTS